MSKLKSRVLKPYARNKWFKGRQLLRSAVSFTNKNWFIPREVNKDGVNIAYGPRNGILFLSDTNEESLTATPLEKLDFVFTYGDFEPIGPLMSDFIPYIDKKLGSDLLITYIEKSEAIHYADEYGYVYVIDASKSSNLICIPNSKFNSRNKKFMQSIDIDLYCAANIPNFYMLASSLKPAFIVGAFATQYLAFSLNINEETLIVNPNYMGDVAAIKTKLKVSNSKAFKDCVLQAQNYTEAKAKYESPVTGLNNRFLFVQQGMKRVETTWGLEKVIHIFPRVKEIIDSTPFTPFQLSTICQTLIKSKKAADCVHNAYLMCLQFEQGFYEEQCAIRFLPELVRHKIYSYVYPIRQENNSSYKKARGSFLKSIASNSCFFSKHQDEASQVNETEEKQFKLGNKANFARPSTNTL